MTNSKKITIHGVEVTQTQLQGKWYTPVDGRVKIAEHADPALVRREGAGYHVVAVQIMPVGDRWAYHCLVEYPVGSGVVKPGTDFIDLKDNAGIAKAETSAIGRALGLHGIACEESIASAEEVESVTGSEETDAIGHSASAISVISDDEPATAEQQERMRKYREALGISERAIAITDNRLRFADAEKRIHEYIAQWKQQKQLQAVQS